MGLSDKAVIVAGGDVLQRFCKLAVGIILVRLVTQAEYGTYRQTWLTYELFSQILLIGLPASVYYFLPRLDARRKRGFVIQTVLMLTVLGALVSAGMGLGRNAIARFGSNPALGILIGSFLLVPLFDLPFKVWPGLLISLGKHLAYAVSTWVFSLLFVVAVVGPVLLGWGLSASFVCLGVLFAIRYVFMNVYWPRLIPVRKAVWDPAMLKKTLSFCLPLGLARAISILGLLIDKVFIFRFFNAAKYAIYSVGAVQVPIVPLVASAALNVLLPEFSRLDKENQHEKVLALWHEATRKTALLVLPAFFLLMTIAGRLVPFVYTKSYEESVILFRIYLLMLPLRVTRYGEVLSSVGRTKPVFRASLLYLLLNTALSYALLKLFGFVGPAIATVVSLFVMVLYYLMVIRTAFRTTFLRLLPFGKLFSISAVLALVSAVVYPVTLLELGDAWVIALCVVLFAACYLVLGSKFGVFTGRDRQFVLGWLTLKPLRGGKK